MQPARIGLRGLDISDMVRAFRLRTSESFWHNARRSGQRALKRRLAIPFQHESTRAAATV
jgi:hypothetical protein